MKTCSKCKIEKLAGEFSENKSKKDGLQSLCKKCSNERNKQYYQTHKKDIDEYQKQYRQTHKKEGKQYRQTHKKERRISDLKRAYNTTLPELKIIYKNQKGKCGICEKKIPFKPNGHKGLVTDHTDINGKPIVRGLLCVECNAGIGMLGDNYEGVMKAARYLKPFG